MQERAAKQGIVLSFENHTGSIGGKPEDCLALLEAVPGLKLDFDFSHVVACGITLDQTKPLWKHVAHVGVRNVKNGSFNEPVRDGKLDRHHRLLEGPPRRQGRCLRVGRVL